MPTPGNGRFLLLAILTHGLLLAMLVVGVQWRHEPPVALQAELWSLPSAQPVPVTRPEPPREEIAKPLPKAAPPPPTPASQTSTPPLAPPDIALERKRKEQERKEQERKEQERKERDQKERERRDQEKRKELERQSAQREREAAQKEAARREAEQTALRREQEQQQQVAQREADLARVMSQASETRAGQSPLQGAARGASSGAATGAAEGGWAAKLSGTIRNNTRFQIPSDLVGNPRAVFSVRVRPNCSIDSVTLRRSSGNPAWDVAAERAIRRTDPLPPHPDGPCPDELEIAQGPRDER